MRGSEEDQSGRVQPLQHEGITAVAVVGVDACQGGWIARALRASAFVEARFVASVAGLAEAVPDAEVTAIDIPIGCPGAVVVARTLKRDRCWALDVTQCSSRRCVRRWRQPRATPLLS
jgi:hypothetical protein